MALYGLMSPLKHHRLFRRHLPSQSLDWCKNWSF